MGQLETIPSHIQSVLDSHQIAPESIKMAASADLSTCGKYDEVWVLVTRDKIFVLTGETVGGSIPAHRIKRFLKKKDEVPVWNESTFREYLLKDLSDIKTESFASSGMVSAKVNGSDIVICQYTNTHAFKFGILANLTNKLKEGKELTEEDFKSEYANARCPKCGRLYPEPNRKVCPNCMDKKALFLRVLSFAPRYKVQIGLILLCMFISSLLKLATPYIGGQLLFDQVLPKTGKYHGRILETVLILAGTQLVSLLVSIAYGRINSVMTAEVIFDLKTEIFTAMQRLSLGFYSNKQTGNLMTRVNGDAMHLQYFFHDGLPYFIVNIITIIGISIAMLIMNWHLAVFVLFPVPLIVFFFRKVFPRLFKLFSKRFRQSSAMNSLINDTLTGARIVKAFGKESTEIKRFAKVNYDVYSINKDIGYFIGTMFPIVNFVMGIGGVVVWGYGGWQVVNGTLTFGTLIAFTGYLGLIYGPLEFMTNIVNWWSSSMNSAQRIFEIMDAVPDVADKPDAAPIPDIKGSITLKDVTFSYEPNKPVLHNISLEVKEGEMIGLVGHSGAGKSTLTNLISRLYDVTEGSILIDGMNVKDVCSRDLRKQIGMVLQETYLFTGTLAENIAYAKPDATMEEIIQATKAANAHDFIVKLPDGYNTVIGRMGHNLSGGERQRISIARAILLDPRILILDEATASLDTETEWQIQEALERLVKGRTTLSIAHRLSTLRNADRLVVIENGKVAETGTHMELVKLKGIYYNMLRKQSEALKIKGVGD